MWSEGYISTILFKINEAQKENIFLEIEVEPAMIKNNKLKFNIFVNDALVKTHDLNEDYKLNKILLNLKKILIILIKLILNFQI